eukprot:TRINITY_DN13125_c0_g1_i3.p1 TRINITY_DN13125_c0_g1~~TRINITY_DN13125_c0_g1_i3.p1  ORF type:complete len:500 (-),score=20.60 TRINITY_DN13125_c0_g1_i3:365-1831(-)
MNNHALQHNIIVNRVPWVVWRAQKSRKAYFAGKHWALTQNTPLNNDSDTLLSLEEQQLWRKQKIRQILSFYGPALSIPLSDPLMSLLDTLCIGQFSGTVELASLGPSSIIFSFVNNTYYMMASSITSLVSKLLTEKNVDMAQDVTTLTLIGGALIGIGLTIFLTLFLPQCLALIGANQEILEPAMVYSRIRLLAQPAITTVVNCQFIWMGQQNSTWSLAGVATQGVINLFLDILLIKYLGWGLRGAAWATVVAQYFSMALMLWSVRYGKGRVKLQWRTARSNFKNAFLSISSMMGALGFAAVMKNTCYLLISQAASCLSTVQVAAHQAMFSLWNMLVYTNGPNYSSALAFIPTAKSRWEERQIQKLIENIGFVNGLVNGIVCVVIATFAPHWFTPDFTLYSLLSQIAPIALLSLIVAGVEVGYQGVLVAKQEVAYINLTYVACVSVVTGYYMWILKVWGQDLFRVWIGLTMFFVTRFLCNKWRLRQLL